MFSGQDGQPATSGRARRRGHILSVGRVDACGGGGGLREFPDAPRLGATGWNHRGNTGKVWAGDTWYIFNTQK